MTVRAVRDFADEPLAELADAVFVAGQVMAIRIDTMRSLHGDGIGRGALEERIDESVRQGQRLATLFSTLYGLIPREREAKAAIAALLADDPVARSMTPDHVRGRHLAA